MTAPRNGAPWEPRPRAKPRPENVIRGAALESIRTVDLQLMNPALTPATIASHCAELAAILAGQAAALAEMSDTLTEADRVALRAAVEATQRMTGVLREMVKRGAR